MTIWMLEHVWQSTLCALVAALLAGLMHRSPARTRHAIWLCASIKFVVPLSLFVTAGTYLGEWMSSMPFRTPAAFAAAGGVAASVMPQTGGPAAAAIALMSPLWPALGATLGVIWASGVAALTLWRWRQHRAVTRLVRASAPVHAGRVAVALRRVMRTMGLTRIELRVSDASVSGAGAIEPTAFESGVIEPGAIEPGVVGIRRATVLWPAGLEHRLSDGELDAIVAHELRHVARRDNLIGRLHMMVETLFWFHPLVWWIGTRLTSERERACDEEVLHMGIDGRDYAEGIVKVCGFCLRAPTALMAGIGARPGSGSSLAARVERILGRPALAAPTAAARLLLSGVIAATVSVPIIAGASSATRASQNQSQPDNPAIHQAGKDGVTVPVVKHKVNPDYTEEAKKAGIQGSMTLEAIIFADGTVGDVTVSNSLDKQYGLDDEGVEAMKQWRFDPGKKDGKPVDVRIKVEMRFTLR